jgi:hypothetical protein
MSELSDKHRRSRILKAETQPDDSASNSEHDQSVREGLQEHSEDDYNRADDDGVLPADLFDEPPQEELREDSTETLSTIEDA